MPNPNDELMTAVQVVDRLGFKVVGALARIFGAEAAKDEESFSYSLNPSGFANLTAVIGNQATANIDITQEADFVCTRVTQTSIATATGVPLPVDTESWSATIKDGSTDRLMMNVPAHALSVFGSGKRSTPWTKNRLFRRNSTIFFTFTQLQAVATQIWLTLWGYKVYDQRSLNLTSRRS